MDKLKFFKILFLVFPLISFISCGKNENECTGNEVCTKIYVAIGVKVMDKYGSPVLLDDLIVKLSDTDELLKDENNNFPYNSGNYLIAGDSSLKKLKKGGSQIHVRGIKADKQIFYEEYIIGHDCCHVMKITGKDTLIIE